MAVDLMVQVKCYGAILDVSPLSYLFLLQIYVCHTAQLSLLCWITPYPSRF